MQRYMDHLLRSDIRRAFEEQQQKEREDAKRRHPSNYDSKEKSK